MRIALASRIFEPEPSAASFRLAALAQAFVDAGHDVTVLTVRPPRTIDFSDTARPYAVRRAGVLRDKSGYVRGYVQYMSFDIPLFFRLLFSQKFGLIVVEPPPTTGFFVRLAARLRSTPYAYYAADIWSDASAQTTAPNWVVKVVRWVEQFALKGAATVLSVSDGVTGRLAQLGVHSSIRTVGNGVDARVFSPGLATEADEAPSGPVFVYAGTASEWHGASVFVEAMPQVLAVFPHAKLRFIGGGSEPPRLAERAESIGVRDAVSFEPVMPPAQVAPILRSASAAIASVRPGHGYDFAFPTKLYSAAICGAPMIYSGEGPAVGFVRTEVEGEPLGTAVPADVDAVAAAMITMATSRRSPERRKAIEAWAIANVSLSAVAAQAVSQLTAEKGSGAEK